MKPIFNHRSPLSPVARRIARALVVAILIMAAVAGIVALAVPPWLKSTLEQQIAQQTGRQLTLDRVAINPLTLRVNLSGLRLLEADKSTLAFSADSLSIRVSIASLFRLAPVMGEIVLTHPHLHLVRRLQDGKEITNFSDIQARLNEHPGQGDPLQYSVSNIQLLNGSIELDDLIALKHIHFTDVKLGVPFVSNFNTAVDVFVEPTLSARVDGSLIELIGRSTPFAETHDTTLAIDVERFNLTELVAYAPNLLPFKIKSALLTSHLTLNFVEQKNQPKITLAGTARLADLSLTDKSGAPLFSAKKIDVNLADLDLTSQQFKLNALELDEPQVWVDLNQQGVLNWLALKNSDQTVEVKTPVVKSSPPLFELAQLKIKDGTLHWSDAAYAQPAFAMQLTHIDTEVQHISTNPKAAVAKFTLSAGGRERLKFDGTLHLAQGAVSGQLTLSELLLQNYQPYLNGVLSASLSGTLGLKTQVQWQQGQLRLNEFSAAIDALQLQASGSGKSDFRASHIGVEQLSLDMKTRQVQIAEVKLEQLQTAVLRDAHGELNLLHWLKPVAAPAKTAAASTAPPWKVQLEQLSLSGSNFSLDDQSVSPRLTLKASNVSAMMQHLSSAMLEPVPFHLQTTLNQSGQLMLDGSLTAKNLQMQIGLQNLALAALAPYFADYLNITIAKGTLSTQGKLSWNAPAVLKYRGALQLANFYSTDKQAGDDFLKWSLLDVSGIDIALGNQAPVVTLDKVNLSDFYARAILSQQGQLNLKNILVRQPASPSDASQKSAPPVITIGQIKLGKGVINYTDNFIKPHYSMLMTGMQGSIGLLQSMQAIAAPVQLNGKLDDEAPVAISGSFNPLYSPLLLDIKMTATGVDLPRLTSYSAKYVGYGIEKGKLSLDVDYHIRNNELHANNVLTLDQLTFGEKVDSPEATSLPVPFVVSLLTDDEGRINLELPISGTINDPQFSIGGLLGKVVLDLVEKVITSPFALFTHRISGGDQLSFIEFNSGSAQLTEASKAKLDDLSRLLIKRPAVQLNITGRADMVADNAGLRVQLLEQQIRKYHDVYLEPGSDPTILPEERVKAIAALYGQATFAKARNLLGIAKSLPAGQMESLLIANTGISEDDLLALALRREVVVHTYLLNTVAPERMYSLAPRLDNSDIRDGSAPTRVDFDLKM